MISQGHRLIVSKSGRSGSGVDDQVGEDHQVAAGIADAPGARSLHCARRSGADFARVATNQKLAIAILSNVSWS